LNTAPYRFGANLSVFVQLLWVVLFAGAIAIPARSQAKPERQSKAVKPGSTTPTAQPTAAAATDSNGVEASKPEEQAFKGMKYRLIGPFRGGRSLTAAGIPGDPTTYYFGATGGGVWKSTDGAMLVLCFR
jgi:hypothetical protein